MVAGTSSASAAITSFTVNDKASVQLDGTVVVVSGFVQCDFGDMINIGSSVFQNKGQLQIQGFGTIGTIACTGSRQMWSVPVQVFVGEAFKHGQASSVTSVFDFTDGTFISVDQNLKLGN
jgi:hypothetical protein